MKTKNKITNRVTKALEILTDAMQAFGKATGFKIKILETMPERENQPVAVLQINVPEGKAKKYCVEIKGGITKATLGYAAEQIRRFKKPGILVTRIVTPQMAERLRDLNIAFIDTAGNAYINDPPVFLYIIGKKNKDHLTRNVVGRAFRPTGLKVVFALLCQPGLVKAPYRDIVKATHVAQGTVGWVMYDLKQQNYLVDRGKRGRKLINVAKLLNVWAENYALELRPKLTIGKYKTKNPGWWKKIRQRKTNTFLGAEPAAAVLTDYLKPATITVYGPEEINQFLLMHRLKKDPVGDVELLKKFWEFNYPWNYQGIAPPLLIYADLIATADDRNIETARIIYDQFINRFIEKL